MRFHSCLIELVLTPTYLFGFFIAVTLILHLLFVWCGSLDEIQWKKVDYFWLAGAVWGFIWLSTDLNKTFTEMYVRNGDVKHIEFEYRELISDLSKGIPVCLQYTKGELSPPTFDDEMAENKVLCEASRAYVKAMPKEVREPFPSLKELAFNGFKGQFKFNDYYINAIQEQADRYSNSRESYTRLINAATPSETLQLIRLLSPLALAIACALRLTKVSGEIKIARRKKMTT